VQVKKRNGSYLIRLAIGEEAMESDCLTPLACPKTIVQELDDKIALMPPLFLDRAAVHIDRSSGHDLCG
jgi:hypothetical protein